VMTPLPCHTRLPCSHVPQDQRGLLLQPPRELTSPPGEHRRPNEWPPLTH
jgi:hypothetical protein